MNLCCQDKIVPLLPLILSFVCLKILAAYVSGIFDRDRISIDHLCVIGFVLGIGFVVHFVLGMGFVVDVCCRSRK